MNAPVLNLQGVHKAYGKVQALAGIDLALMPGQFVGLLGPNGAGKSTLFQIASGLFAADAGRVELFGTTFRDDPSGILSRLGVVFQSRSLDVDIPVRANLRFHGNLFGLWGRTLSARIDEVAEVLQIGDMLDLAVRKLSGGNQRRVEIARALLNRPELMLLDEPSTGLDTAARVTLIAHIRRIVTERRLAVLWATHLVDEVQGADRIVVLSRGRVLASGTAADLAATTRADDLTSAYIALTGPAQ